MLLLDDTYYTANRKKPHNDKDRLTHSLGIDSLLVIKLDRLEKFPCDIKVEDS